MKQNVVMILLVVILARVMMDLREKTVNMVLYY